MQIQELKKDDLLPLWGLAGALRPCKIHHPGVKLRANLKSISHKCHLFEVAFVWELTEDTIHLPLGCLQGGV